MTVPWLGASGREVFGLVVTIIVCRIIPLKTDESISLWSEQELQPVVQQCGHFGPAAHPQPGQGIGSPAAQCIQLEVAAPLSLAQSTAMHPLRDRERERERERLCHSQSFERGDQNAKIPPPSLRTTSWLLKTRGA